MGEHIKAFHICGKLFISGVRTLLGALAPRLSIRYFAGRRYYAVRGPRSTCCQSRGIPFASSLEPPPHRKPFMKRIRPQMCFIVRVAFNPKETSAPVAGHERWVDNLSGAAGLPCRCNCRCSWGVRYPEIICTRVLVSAK